MSTDSSAAAFARLDAPAEEFGPPTVAPPRDLAEFAAALARIETLLAGGAEGPEGAAAIERIADIAFVLHERDIEPSLCDALDDAVREIGAADALKRASLQRARAAAALLRELSHALSEMIGTEVEQQPQAAAIVPDVSASSSSVLTAQESRNAEEAEEDELAAPAGLFDAEMPEDDAFALAVAALAQALPESAGTAPADLQDEVAEFGALSETVMPCKNAADEQTIEAVQSEEAIVSYSSAEADLHEHMSGGRSLAAEHVDLGAGPSEHIILPGAALNEPLAAPGGPDVTSSESSIAAIESAEPALAGESAPTHPDVKSADIFSVAAADEVVNTTARGAVAAAPAEIQPAVDPDDDPGDLFEPVADGQPQSPPSVPAAIAAPASDDGAARASMPLAALPPAASAAAKPPHPAAASAWHFPVAAPPQVTSEPTANDPLAAIRALSEEEMIALFS